MASIRSVSTVGQSSRVNTTITAPTGIVNGDLLVAVFGSISLTVLDVTPPAGWNYLTAGDFYSVDRHTLRIYYKVASSESGNYTFSHSSAETEGVIFAISGADTTNPFNPIPTVNQVLNSTATALGLSPERDSCVIICAYLCENNLGPITGLSGTTPTFTEYYDPVSFGNMYVAGGVLAEAQATGNKQISAGSTNETIGIMLCVNNAIPLLDQHSFRFFNDDAPSGPAFVNGTYVTSGAYSGDYSDLPSISVTDGNAIIVCVSNFTAGQPQVSSITDSYGNTYTMCGAEGNGNSSHTMEMWIAHNVTGGASNVIRVNFSASAQFRHVLVAQYSGLATSDAYDSGSSTAITPAALTHTTNTVTTTANDDLLIGFYVAWDVAAINGATDPNFARVVGAGCAIVEKLATTAGSYTVTATSSQSTLSAQACFVRAFKKAANTALANLNTNINLLASESVRLRFLINGSNDPTARSFRLEYRRKPLGGSFSQWTKVQKIPFSFTDNFNRTDGAVGNNWVMEDAAAYSISGNKLIINTGTYSNWYDRVMRRPAREAILNQIVTADITKIGALGGNPVIAARLNQTVDTGYMFYLVSSETTVYVGRTIASAITPLAWGDMSIAFTDGDRISMRLSVTNGVNSVIVTAEVYRWTGAGWINVFANTYVDTDSSRIDTPGVAGISDQGADSKYAIDNFTYNEI